MTNDEHLLAAAFPVDPGLLLKLVGTLVTAVLGWIVSRAQPPRSGEANFIGYHRGAIRALSVLTVLMVIACAASFWWAPPHLSVVLLFPTLGLGVFTCYALRLGLATRRMAC